MKSLADLKNKIKTCFHRSAFVAGLQAEIKNIFSEIFNLDCYNHKTFFLKSC